MDNQTIKAFNGIIRKQNVSILQKYSEFIEEKLELTNIKDLVNEFMELNNPGSKKKINPSVFNYYVKDYTQRNEIKGKDALIKASESWKNSAKGVFIKEKAKEVKEENPTFSNEEIYNRASELYENESNEGSSSVGDNIKKQKKKK